MRISHFLELDWLGPLASEPHVTAISFWEQMPCCCLPSGGSEVEESEYGATAETGGELHGNYDFEGRFTELGRYEFWHNI